MENEFERSAAAYIAGQLSQEDRNLIKGCGIAPEEVKGTFERFHDMKAEIEKLNAELECARGDLKTAMEIVERNQKDADRYRYLCDKFGETKLPCALERILTGDIYVADGKPSIDWAIDQAIALERT